MRGSVLMRASVLLRGSLLMVWSVSRRFLLVLSQSGQDHVLEDESANRTHDVTRDYQERYVLYPRVLHCFPKPGLVSAESVLSKIAINLPLLDTNDLAVHTQLWAGEVIFLHLPKVYVSELQRPHTDILHRKTKNEISLKLTEEVDKSVFFVFI